MSITIFSFLLVSRFFHLFLRKVGEMSLTDYWEWIKKGRLLFKKFTGLLKKKVKPVSDKPLQPVVKRLTDLRQRNFSCRIRDGTLYGQLKVKSFTEAYLFFLNIAGQCDQVIRKPDNRICYIRQYDPEHQLTLINTVRKGSKPESRIEGIGIKIRIVYISKNKINKGEI
ncbi:MAG: hypothetical protein LUH10_18545 [Tannerellaceae bacterium]|nr:hypothetical protein [Tannerellaceae bacterium]